MAVSLTEGSLEAICNGNSDIRVVLQVAEVCLVNYSKNTSERYRLLLSDGVHLVQGMLASQLNELVKSGRLQKWSILMLIQYVCNVIQDKRQCFRSNAKEIGFIKVVGTPNYMCPELLADIPYGFKTDILSLGVQSDDPTIDVLTYLRMTHIWIVT